MVLVPLHEGSAAPRPVMELDARVAAILYPPLPPADLLPAPVDAASSSLAEIAGDELVNPITGEIVDPASIDDLIDCYEYIDRKDKAIYAVKQRIKSLLLERTESDGTTRRVAGARRVAKLTMPGESFEQPVLKRLFAEYPDLAEKYLRIESVAVQMREFNKMRTTSSDQEDFIAFRDALTAASRGRAGLPSVTVEK